MFTLGIVIVITLIFTDNTPAKEKQRSQWMTLLKKINKDLVSWYNKKGGIIMLKSYDPEKAFGLTHIVENTYMFDNGKVVVRTPIESECAGADLLSTCVDDSDWVGDLDGFGEYESIKLEGIKRLEYDDDLDELEVYLSNGKIWYIAGDDISDYLIKVEIVKIGKGDI